MAEDTRAVSVHGGTGRPIFIVGCARSGTTMLQLMLHAHPRIAIPPETRYLTEGFDLRAEFGDLRESGNVDALVDWILDDDRRVSRDLGLDEEEYRDRARRASPTIGTVLGLALQMYAERWDKPRWGDKRPSYFKRVDALLQMFPDAQIVHLVRDGRDCVASLKEMKWWGSGSIGAMCNWVAAMSFGRRAHRNLDPTQFIELHYERLVARPEEELRRLCDFLGERFDDAMLAPHEMAPTAVPKRKRRRHHRHTTGAVSDHAIGRWADDLEPWEVALFEAVAARHLRRHGYELTAGRRPVPPPLPLARYVRQALRVRRRDAERRRTERRTAARYGHPVVADLRGS